MKFKSVLMSVLLIIFISLGCGQVEVQLLDDQILHEFIHGISGIRAKAYVETIAQYNRTEGGYEDTGYEKAVNYVMSILEEADVEDIELHTYLSDGTKTYGTWRSQSGFRVKDAKLYLVMPEEVKWCDFFDTPVSLMPYSNGKGVDEAEVVYVGRGMSEDDYVDKEVMGKIVFADRGDAASVMRQAVLKRGALGIVMGFSGNSRRGKYPGLVELNRLYVTGEETKTSTWGFSLSKARTDSLKTLLVSNQKVVMRAEVNAETFSGNMPIISAVIRGCQYPDQEIIYMAHLDHYKPGANDNASGSAGLMEIVTTLTKMINEGRIPRPLRTMRFLWVPEWEGTASYIENNMETAKKGIVGINLDMIGEDLKKCQTRLIITRTPFSRPSFLDALIGHYLKFVDDQDIISKGGSRNKFKYRMIDYMGESDHLFFNDARIGVPSTMLVHLTDVFWHTSMDTPDKVDPTELKRCIMLGLLTGWTSANYDDESMDDMVELVCQDIEKKMKSYSQKYLTRLRESEKNSLHGCYRHVNAYLDLLLENGMQSLESIHKNLPGLDPKLSAIENGKERLRGVLDGHRQKAKDRYEKLCKEKGIGSGKGELSLLELECNKMIPQRKMELPLSYWLVMELLRKEGLQRSMNYDMVWEMFNSTNGKNSMLDIRDAVSAQFREVEIGQVKAMFDVFRERNFVVY